MYIVQCTCNDKYMKQKVCGFLKIDKKNSFRPSYYNVHKSYLRECEANNVINSLNCDGFDIGSRCSLNLPDLR